MDLSYNFLITGWIERTKLVLQTYGLKYMLQKTICWTYRHTRSLFLINKYLITYKF